MTAAVVRVTDLVVDCNDLGGQPAFWTGLLGLAQVSRSEDWVELGPLGAGGPALCFQLVPEAKMAKNRLHLDLLVPDAVAAGRRAAGLGATAVSALHQGREGPWQVWRDPEGNEFCLISGTQPQP
jgi:catechol 2,3-dioxygenase-like lactoylglutathione lyase family enzyme